MTSPENHSESRNADILEEDGQAPKSLIRSSVLAGILGGLSVGGFLCFVLFMTWHRLELGWSIAGGVIGGMLLGLEWYNLSTGQ